MFTAKSKGRAVHRFTENLLARGHASKEQYARRTYLFRVDSRAIYEMLGRTNLRPRSKSSQGPHSFEVDDLGLCPLPSQQGLFGDGRQ